MGKIPTSYELNLKILFDTLDPIIIVFIILPNVYHGKIPNAQ